MLCLKLSGNDPMSDVVLRIRRSDACDDARGLSCCYGCREGRERACSKKVTSWSHPKSGIWTRESGGPGGQDLFCSVSERVPLFSNKEFELAFRMPCLVYESIYTGCCDL